MHPELKAIWDQVDFPHSTSGVRRSTTRPSDLGPNLEPAYRLGQQLDVDAMLMYAMDPHYGYDFMWIYLLDVRQRRRYVIDAAVWYYEISGTGKIKDMTHQVFANFIQDQSTK